jgi:cyclopropane-fatty-acyl-phospholipid synthase
MNSPSPKRGYHMLSARRGLIARAVSRIFHRILDRIDAGIEAGALEAVLPDGTFRVLGGRAPGPLVHVNLNSWRALIRLGQSGSVGWYQAWEAGEWDSPDPVPLFDLFMRNRVSLGSSARASGLSRVTKRIAHALRRNDSKGAKRNIMAHYDLGNDFYECWLDPTMSYSSALFEDSDTLEAAQHRKMVALMARLDLKPGSDILEIGCGWGHFAKHCAQGGHEVTAITLSPSQKLHAEAAVAGMANAPTYQLLDYRDVRGSYDAIASIEMVEAVGQAYWPAYLDVIARSLKPGGRAAIQFIMIADDIFERYAQSADFIQTYVFPGGMLLSESRFRALAEARGLCWDAPQHFGIDYAETLKLWRERFDDAVEAGKLPSGFDERFIKLWGYYLMYCEGGFRGGGIDVAQVTLIKQ